MPRPHRVSTSPAGPAHQTADTGTQPQANARRCESTRRTPPPPPPFSANPSAKKKHPQQNRRSKPAPERARPDSFPAPPASPTNPASPQPPTATPTTNTTANPPHQPKPTDVRHPSPNQRARANRSPITRVPMHGGQEGVAGGLDAGRQRAADRAAPAPAPTDAPCLCSRLVPAPREHAAITSPLPSPCPRQRRCASCLRYRRDTQERQARRAIKRDLPHIPATTEPDPRPSAPAEPLPR